MSSKTRHAFEPNGEYVAKKDFRFHGKTYLTDKEFPWRTLSCSVRKLRSLYEAGFLKYKKEPVEESSESGESIPGQEFFLFKPGEHEIKRPKRGECSILVDGEEVLTIPRDLAKELEEATEPVSIPIEDD